MQHASYTRPTMALAAVVAVLSTPIAPPTIARVCGRNVMPTVLEPANILFLLNPLTTAERLSYPFLRRKVLNPIQLLNKPTLPPLQLTFTCISHFLYIDKLIKTYGNVPRWARYPRNTTFHHLSCMGSRRASGLGPTWSILHLSDPQSLVAGSRCKQLWWNNLGQGGFQIHHYRYSTVCTRYCRIPMNNQGNRLHWRV